MLFFQNLDLYLLQNNFIELFCFYYVKLFVYFCLSLGICDSMHITKFSVMSNIDFIDYDLSFIFTDLVILQEFTLNNNMLLYIFLKKYILSMYLLHVLSMYIIIHMLVICFNILKHIITALYLKCTLLILFCIICYNFIHYICQNIFIVYVQKTKFFFDMLITDKYYILIQIFVFFIYWLYLYNLYILKYKNKLIWDLNSDILLLLNIATYLNLKLVICSNLLYFVILIEALTLLLIIVCVSMGFLKEDIKSAEEAGFKLYINNAVSTGFLLLGISLLYGGTGLIYLTDIAFFFNNIYNYGLTFNFLINTKEFILVTGFFFFLVGIFTKMMQSPFHLWAKDIYEGSSFYFTTYMATISKIGILFFFVNNILLFTKCVLILKLCVYLGLFSTIVGILGTLQQKKFKSFIAYSSIAAIGPLLIVSGISTNIYNTSIINIMVLPYIISYLCIVLFLFLIISRLGKIHLYNNNYLLQKKKKFIFIQLKELSELAGLWFKHKQYAILILVLLFTLIAIPPFFNFLLKTYILLIFVKTNHIFLAFIFLLYGVLGCLYYLKLIKLIIFDNVNNHLYILKTTFFLNFLISFCVIFLILGFLYPTIVTTLFFSLY